MQPRNDAPIGVLDSGVGGLSIVRALQAELTHESIVYVADQFHLPYGPRPLEEIRRFVFGITQFLLAHHAKIIVVACNAASAASLHYLRATFPQIPFVGMEPAVKPAATATRSGVVGVLTTAATAGGPLYASVRERFASNVEVDTLICPELVEAVEQNAATLDALRPVFDRVLRPALDHGADQIVLACTHFPFAIEAIQAYVGPEIEIVDPSPAIARQTRRVLAAQSQLAPDGEHPPASTFFTTGDRAHFERTASALLQRPITAHALAWNGDRLEMRQV
ncbi:MAG: glutamate racemase [Anaerolineae bacterium]